MLCAQYFFTSRCQLIANDRITNLLEITFPSHFQYIQSFSDMFKVWNRSVQFQKSNGWQWSPETIDNRQTNFPIQSIAINPLVALTQREESPRRVWPAKMQWFPSAAPLCHPAAYWQSPKSNPWNYCGWDENVLFNPFLVILWMVHYCVYDVVFVAIV